MTNTTTKRRHNKYQDVFEIHKIQSEANIKKMKMEKRLNVISGNAINSGTTPVTLKGTHIFRKRNVLQDKTNIPQKRIQNNKNDMLAQKSTTISNMRDSIMALHRKPNPPTIGIPRPPQRNSSKISIFELTSIIRNTNFTRYVKQGFNNRYFEISRDILSYVPYGNTSHIHRKDLSLKIHTSMKCFVEWFKINRFDYLIIDKNIKELRNQEEQRLSPNKILVGDYLEKEKKEGIVQKLTRQRYTRNFFKKDKPTPTHIIQETKNLSRFMLTAKVKDISKDISLVIILLKTDSRFDVRIGDLLVLTEKACYKQMIDQNEVSVYLSWHIYKEEPIDIDFFG